MSLKRAIWRFGVGCCRIICSARIRRLLCSMMWEAAANNRAAETVLRELFIQQDILEQWIDRTAIKYECGIHPKHRLMGYHDFFCHRIKRGEHVLDIGCGCGAVAKSISDKGAWVTAVDMDQESLNYAKSRYGDSKIEFLHADATCALPRGPFDVIVLSNVLEHIQDRIAFIKKIQSTTQPSRYLIRVPMINRAWSVPMRRELGLSYYSDPGHYVEYTFESFKKEMTEAGMDIHQLIINWGEIWAEVHSQSENERYLKLGCW